MTEINLLPWRELKREQDKKQFTTILALMFVFSVLVVFLLHYYASGLIENQTNRNQTLRSEIQAFDNQIGEIQKIKELTAAFVSRMTVVQNLQATRPLTIHLFDELIRVLPDGIHINKIVRNGDNVDLYGVATSNTNVSDLMRNIENNKWIRLPVLTEIKKSRDKAGAEENEFKLGFILKPEMDSTIHFQYEISGKP